LLFFEKVCQELSGKFRQNKPPKPPPISVPFHGTSLPAEIDEKIPLCHTVVMRHSPVAFCIGAIFEPAA
jgi:hypothetical protein